ncbi:MAG TPA: glycosyltransferase family 2 protein [Sphingomonas sp.]|jgi:glycosyltransferase involved in cell wall biosynthesis|uniref:glycosyltransferase family 2 protein n=1 Tax=Sphingomonas sp. TaxID=28214 RepID=UPI002EDAACB3
MSAAIAILIPTFRRPALLATLLDSLLADGAGQSAVVVVGDNDCDLAIAALVAGYASRGDVRYLAVPARGVSQVRNALVAEAMRIVPDWRWLLMLDDDGVVKPGWLERLVSCGDRYSADLIGGPVEGALPPGANAFARRSMFAARRRWSTGPIALLNTTQNLGIARRLLELLPLPLFDSRYGASGGEDYDLFRRTARAGGLQVWCDEAVVVEPAPPERLTPRSLLNRYFTIGIYMGPIDAAYDGRGRTFLRACKGLTLGVQEAVLGLVRRKAEAAAHGTLMIAHHGGRLCGLAGARSARYVKTEVG